ncbi:MAG: L,D-transpeptidase [Acidimicrobiales bacterium]
MTRARSGTGAMRATIAITVLFVAFGCGNSPHQLQSAPASPDDTARELLLPPRPMIATGPTIMSEPNVPPASTTSTSTTPSTGPSTSPPTSPSTTAEPTRLVGLNWPDDTGVSGRTIVAHAASDRIMARDEPDRSGLIIQGFDNPTERGGPLVFQAIGEPVGGWIEVLLPIRPNGSTGWVPVADVSLSRNPYRIVVDVDSYELTVFREEATVLSTTVAIGTGATPTPIGDFFLTELFQPPDPAGLYGPYAYGLSGFSDTLDSFNGGPGIIGIHGTNQPELLGSNVSHGCVRVDNAVISEMAAFLPLGTPISIHR